MYVLSRYSQQRAARNWRDFRYVLQRSAEVLRYPHLLNLTALNPNMPKPSQSEPNVCAYDGQSFPSDAGYVRHVLNLASTDFAFRAYARASISRIEEGLRNAPDASERAALRDHRDPDADSIERIARTLRRPPSEKVREVYRALAAAQPGAPSAESQPGDS
ncbi:hypothetical protein F6X40_10215 [Paraburkholderia sp. UCT31]|uniref:hypothetical protein n=1 Tax=Paraburkholderia sp. UCT31 TaxID=2615209 RepID=UPI0016557F7C|nr:hypothetical protein [Paraburkholderia sp. UCT31]MBC8737182.1 hypothetical protein [Paraburkholderia sp. UCT31]